MKFAAIFNPNRYVGITIVRIVVAILLGIHGLARIWFGIVDDFGDFLTQTGFPLGPAIGMGSTLFEIGAARNGVEYSLLLIACLAAVAISGRKSLLHK